MKLLTYYSLGLGLILFLSILCSGQEKTHTPEIRHARNNPLELVRAEVRSKAFTSENEVLSDNNWLRDLKLKNNDD